MLKVDIRLSTIILLVILLSLFYADFFDVSPDKQDFKIEKLFTHEGCTVYRFRDKGYTRHFTHCNVVGGSIIIKDKSCP